MDYKIWECLVCGLLYDESKGWPDDNIPPGTRWEDVPDDWMCPDCGVGKEDFEMIEVTDKANEEAVAKLAEKANGDEAATTPEISPTVSSDEMNAVSQVKSSETKQTAAFKIWECLVCGLLYDESKGWPEDNIPPGTRWEDVPEDWECPDCGVGKEDFEMVEVSPDPLEQSQRVDAEDCKPIVIIGTGLAGYNLAREYRTHDITSPLMLVTADDGQFYYKPNLSTGYANNKSPDELVTASAETMATNLNAEILTHTEVRSIDVAGKTIDVDGRKIDFSQLVFATGASNIEIPVEGNASHKMYSVNNLMDYRNFRNAMDGMSKILIIGAGLVGSEYANDMILSGYEVDVVEAMGTVLGNLLPNEASVTVQGKLEDAGVRYHFNTTVERIDKKGEGVVATLVNGTRIDADLVLCSIGVRPDLTLAKSAGLKTNRGIITNRSLETNAKDIYAVGDCAEVDGNLLYYVAPLNSSIKVLAKKLANQDAEVNYGVMPVLVKTTIYPVVVNPPRLGSEGNWEITSDTDGVLAKYMSPTGQQLGFALTGDAIRQKSVLAAQNIRLME